MNAFDFLTPPRRGKPRKNGITMVLDKGMGIKTARDLMEISSDYVDFIKFGWGTLPLHRRDAVMEKIEMYRSFDVEAYPGGTLFEIAYLNDKIQEYFEEARSLGFETLEISNGTVEIETDEKCELIEKAVNEGFQIISEVGKKDPVRDRLLSPEDRVELVRADLKAGACMVLMEARESGHNIGIYDENGNVKEEEFNHLLNELPQDRIIWEAPQKNQQVYFILKIGPDVNLGNIPPEEITALETIRRGLRGDTLGKVNL
ncbi:phosphosulfolactate synthase [Methanothermobacter sp.]|uniref:phosphosulfolactate synthase n=1 Tax=Methanothermobacter sp. TaxID=1884223 RepID=UPI0026139E12|nr:phosphosulfolactate synthase [Methanothermobacter sp.]MDI9615393.1 phosphosulfolactate synthase [Methanothermobacter sp.]